MYSETVAHTLLGWSEGEPAHRYAELMRESIAPETLNNGPWPHMKPVRRCRPAPAGEGSRPWSFTAGDSPGLSADVARGLASRIPDARLTLPRGGSGAAFLGDTDAVLRTLHGFLGEG